MPGHNPEKESMKNEELRAQLSALGRKTEYRQDYAPEVLETFVNKHPDND